MLLIYLVLGCVMMFLSGAFYTAYKVNRIEKKPYHRLIFLSIGFCVFSLYFLISMIGAVE